jgi:two-component system LytT family response regulator
MSMRVLIVDDEPLARRKIRRFLASEDVEVVGECESGEEVVAALETLQPDLLLFDVQIRGMNAFEVIQRVGAARMPATVFITAYSEYAIQAFDVEAVDYLVKPFTRKRFHRALERASAVMQQGAAEEPAEVAAAVGEPGLALEPAPDRYLEWFVVKTSNRSLKLVRARDVDWIEAEGNYVSLHLGDRAYLYRCTLAGMDGRLDPARFVRIHRSTIVNLHSIESMAPLFAGDFSVRLKNGQRVKLSRSYRQALEDRIGRAG